MNDEQLNELRRLREDLDILGIAVTKDGKRVDPLEVPDLVFNPDEPPDPEREEIFEMLRVNGYYSLKIIPGRGVCGLRHFFFTTGICYGLDDTGYAGRYCYENPLEALIALAQWTGEGDPLGDWIVHKGEPGGDRQNPKRQV